jgi:penicillin-binding protein 1B
LVGFDRVAALARNSGIKSAQGTPSMAIGSYDATPLDMAGAYTVFSNGGVHIDPWMLASVRTPTGDIVEDYTPTTRQVLDPRAAFLTTYMMEAVLGGNGIYRAGRGQNRNQPRRLVCRLHLEPAVHRVGGQRRLHRA